MLGDFELPGDDRRSDRVGGQPGAPGLPGAEPAPKQGGAPTAVGVPQAGAGQADATPAGQSSAIPAGQPGGGSAPGEEAPAGGGNESSGAAGAADGVQVAQLGGTGGATEASGLGQRPRAVTIGDKAMQIPTPQGALAGVSANQPAGTTQHHEKPTGTGGKPPVGDNTNKGAERGRAMPPGL